MVLGVFTAIDDYSVLALGTYIALDFVSDIRFHVPIPREGGRE